MSLKLAKRFFLNAVEKDRWIAYQFPKEIPELYIYFFCHKNKFVNKNVSTPISIQENKNCTPFSWSLLWTHY